MDNKEKKNKRIRHPKKQELKAEEGQKEEQVKHFTLQVHDSTITGLNSFGR
jgi:hypothetical protein